MDRNDEYDNGHDDMGFASHRHSSMPNDGSSEEGLDPMDIANPVSAYFFLSDDAQGEISGVKKNMKCGLCGHRFTGESYESCPKCYSINTDEVVAGIDGENTVAEEPNMKCLDCGHTFVRGTYDSCPACYSFNTEEIIEETEESYW